MAKRSYSSFVKSDQSRFILSLEEHFVIDESLGCCSHWIPDAFAIKTPLPWAILSARLASGTRATGLGLFLKKHLLAEERSWPLDT
jgi:hypothetical protein